jgi:hypothetical protein
VQSISPAAVTGVASGLLTDASSVAQCGNAAHRDTYVPSYRPIGACAMRCVFRLRGCELSCLACALQRRRLPVDRNGSTGSVFDQLVGLPSVVEPHATPPVIAQRGLPVAATVATVAAMPKPSAGRTATAWPLAAAESHEESERDGQPHNNWSVPQEKLRKGLVSLAAEWPGQRAKYAR